MGRLSARFSATGRAEGHSVRRLASLRGRELGGEALAIAFARGPSRRAPSGQRYRRGVDPADLAVATKRELELLDRTVRSRPDLVERYLHADFVEIGASGRRRDRTEVIADLAAEPEVGDLTVSELEARHVSDGILLVTYRTSSPDRDVLRSSWWVRVDGDLLMVFHQGTVTTRS